MQSEPWCVSSAKGKHPKQGAPPTRGRDVMGTLAAKERSSQAGLLAAAGLQEGNGASQAATLFIKMVLPLLEGSSGVMLLPWGFLKLLSPVGWRRDGSW